MSDVSLEGVIALELMVSKSSVLNYLASQKRAHAIVSYLSVHKLVNSRRTLPLGATLVSC